MPPVAPAAVAVSMRAVALGTEVGGWILEGIDWDVRRDERWAVLGANGSGKTTLLSLAAALRRPSRGTVDVLGCRLGRVDLRLVRSRVGLASSALAAQLRADLSAADAVVTAKHAALEPWWHRYDEADRRRARHLLDEMGCGGLAGRPLGSLSQGERQRVLLARLLMAEPELLLIDEPAAGLDLPAREALVGRLEALAADPGAPPHVLVTHHVEEIPAGCTHALLLRQGHVVASGAAEEVLRAGPLSECFGLALHLERRSGRYFAWAAR